MAHFAKINENNIVEEVIVIHNDCAPNEKTGQELIASLGFEGVWKQTSYNTVAGVHTLGGVALRKNYAGIGYTYDEARDAFIPPKPSDSKQWVLDEETCQWIM
jgi:hypothetical protein